MEAERCTDCDEPTERAGKGDDSLYTNEGVGPFCEQCFGDGDAIDMREAWLADKARTIKSRTDRIAALEAEVGKWKRIRANTHGNCCQCQACGEDHDDCRCDLDELADDNTTLRAENDALRERIDMALHDTDSALSYPPGHEKERQWVVQAMKTLKGEG